MKPIKTRYAKKMVDGKCYGTIMVKGIADEPPVLTRKEFQEGKQGIVFLDNKTGKIVFDDPEEKK